jgi:hypothetical protein
VWELVGRDRRLKIDGYEQSEERMGAAVFVVGEELFAVESICTIVILIERRLLQLRCWGSVPNPTSLSYSYLSSADLCLQFHTVEVT